MLHLNEFVTIDPAGGQAVYLQISGALTQHIIRGRLRKGSKLPGTREAARQLQINRMTMVAAYEELEAQGWIEQAPRKGAFIRSELPMLAPRKISSGTGTNNGRVKPSFQYYAKKVLPAAVADFPANGMLYLNDGFPDPRIAPVNDLVRNTRMLARLPANKRYLMYGGAQGTVSLREALSLFLNDSRGLAIAKENLLITRGAQMGIYIAASLLIKPGDEVIVGEPGYTGANNTFQQLGARINRVRVDDEGIDTGAVEQLCRRKKIRMVYIIPHHHNPTTVTLTPERRVRLLELAAEYGFAIIEDDYDYDFHYASRPIMPMASLDNSGSVIYIGTLTKTIAPAVRLGFMAAPEEFVRTATGFRKSIDTQGDSLMENAIAAMYRDGSMMRHIKKSVKLYRERRDHFCNLLRNTMEDRICFAVPAGGMSVWAGFPGTDLAGVAHRALKRGLVMGDGREYDNGKRKYNALRLGFASLNFKEQERAIAILKASAGW